MQTSISIDGANLFRDKEVRLKGDTGEMGNTKWLNTWLENKG